MTNQQQITVCAFLYNNEGKLLIAKRAATKKFLPDKFELIGGHTEFGETLEESLIREAKEELEIDIEVELPFYAFTYMSDGGTTHTVEIDYFAKLIDINQKIVLHAEDHSEYKWIEESEVGDYFDENDSEKTAIQVGFKTLQRVLGQLE